LLSVADAEDDVDVVPPADVIRVAEGVGDDGDEVGKGVDETVSGVDKDVDIACRTIIRAPSAKTWLSKAILSTGMYLGVGKKNSDGYHGLDLLRRELWLLTNATSRFEGFRGC
jgi:hypothetical protein